MGEKPQLRKDTTVGDWRIGKFLAAGGQGPVYEVYPTTSSKSPPRALKACFAEDAAGRQRFEREIQLLDGCRSTHVLALVDAKPSWDKHDPKLPPFAYFVAELCEGSLVVLDNKGLLGDALQRLRWFKEACQGVMCIEEGPHKVVHRDIKPDNFLLAREPARIVLADFGIARPTEEESTVTVAHEVVGTPKFRAPENKKDFRSDVFSLGRLLEWMMTGRVALDLVPLRVPRGGALADEVCEVLDQVIEKATNPVPHRRYSSVRELHDSLPELIVMLRPRTLEQATVAESSGPAKVGATSLPDALEAARSGDLMTWRRLELPVRREFPVRMERWRTGISPQVSLGTKAEQGAFVDGLVEAGRDRLTLGLTGALSAAPAIADQRRALEDILEIADWSVNGRTEIVQGPYTLAFVFHHVHGALCCEMNRFDRALQLVTTEVPHPRLEKATVLWRESALTNWPKPFRDCSDSWAYLRKLPERFPFLSEFFATPKDFDVALASYSALLSLLEFAHRAPELQVGDPDELAGNAHHEVAPMFAVMEDGIIATACRRTFGARDVVDLVLGQSPSGQESLKKAWPVWKKVLMRMRRNAHGGFPASDAPFGELA
jgi:hypothetical protein